MVDSINGTTPLNTPKHYHQTLKWEPEDMETLFPTITKYPQCLFHVPCLFDLFLSYWGNISKTDNIHYGNPCRGICRHGTEGVQDSGDFWSRLIPSHYSEALHSPPNIGKGYYKGGGPRGVMGYEGINQGLCILNYKRDPYVHC